MCTFTADSKHLSPTFFWPGNIDPVGKLLLPGCILPEKYSRPQCFFSQKILPGSFQKHLLWVLERWRWGSHLWAGKVGECLQVHPLTCAGNCHTQRDTRGWGPGKPKASEKGVRPGTVVSRGQQRAPETLHLGSAESVQDTSHLGQQNGPFHGGTGAFLLL